MKANINMVQARILYHIATRIIENNDLKWEGHYTGIETAEHGLWYFQRDRESKRITYARHSNSFQQHISWNIGATFTFRYSDSSLFNKKHIIEKDKTQLRRPSEKYIICDRTWCDIKSRHIVLPYRELKAKWLRTKTGRYLSIFTETWKECVYFNKNKDIYEPTEEMTFMEMVRYSHKRCVCNHSNMNMESNITGDSGSEDLYCLDCGYHQHICYY